jgi:small subunit ribosomal protein S20
MANTPSARKRALQSENNRQRNRAYRSRMHTAIKQLRTAIQAQDSVKARLLLPETIRIVDATAAKGVIHRNAAARTKSRLARAVDALEN